MHLGNDSKAHHHYHTKRTVQVPGCTSHRPNTKQITNYVFDSFGILHETKKESNLSLISHSNAPVTCNLHSFAQSTTTIATTTKVHIILYMNSICLLFIYFVCVFFHAFVDTQVKTKHDLPCLLTYWNFCALCVPNKLSRMPFCTMCNWH